MPRINEEQADVIRKYLNWFVGTINRGLAGVLESEVRHFREPAEIADVALQAVRLEEAFKRDHGSNDNAVELDDSLVPILKRLLLSVRASEVENIEDLKAKTHNPDLLETLDEKLRPLDALMGQEWLKNAQPTKIPRLTEYISLQRVEELKGSRAILEERAYDQKFHILQAPGLIIDDLRYYRAKCEIRDTAVIVAFIDIDDFKENFNERYGEVAVDRRVLPRFMEKLESLVFAHGYAYRHGGDEFVLILPNMTYELALVFLDIVRRSIEKVKYPGIDVGTTVSIGFVHVGSDCFLTNREVVEKANIAKKFAKTQGKNRIATFRGLLFYEDELGIVIPQYPSSES